MDTLSASAASRLATKIQLYWAMMGLSVQVWAEPFEGQGVDGKTTTLFQVRSNIVEALRGDRRHVTPYSHALL